MKRPTNDEAPASTAEASSDALAGGSLFPHTLTTLDQQAWRHLTKQVLS
ncbi:hypothetical protein AAG614_01295 [Citromicrobium bathyomarinum]